MPVERDDVGERAAMAINRANWDSRVPVHTGPGGYSIEQLVDDGTALTDVSGAYALDVPPGGYTILVGPEGEPIRTRVSEEREIHAVYLGL